MSRTASLSLVEVDSPVTASFVSGFEVPSAEGNQQDNITSASYSTDVSTDSHAPILSRSISSTADVPTDSHLPNLARSASSSATGYATDAPTESNAQNLSRSVSSVREIYKNSWLKQMPCSDKWTGRIYKSQKPEKFWVVFCVHDEKDAFLEFYENRRSAYSHSPLNSISLAQCLHISPTIVVQDNDHEFVVTLETQVIRLAASTREQMVEWMDTLRNKLRELNVLEPKDNLYTKEPFIGSRASVSSQQNESLSSHEDQLQEGNASQSEMSLSRLSLRDPNSPLPPVPLQTANSNISRDGSVSSASLVYLRNPSLLQSTSNLMQAPVSSATVNGTDTTPQATEASTSLSSMHVDRLVTRQESGVLLGHSTSSQNGNISTPSSYSVPNTPVTSDACLYEPLFHMTSYEQNPQFSVVAVRNPSYENPPEPQRHPDTESVPVLPPKVNSDSRRFSASSSSEQSLRDQRSGSTVLSASQGSLNRPLESTHSFVTRGLSRVSQDEASISVSSTSVNSRISTSRNSGQSEEESSNIANAQPIHGRNSQSYVTALATDESGRVLSLREAQVLKLQAEIVHKSGVRLVLRKKDSVNAIAFVDCFGSVWIAGWKQKEHPLLHNTFHIGDRIFSVAGHRVHSVQEVNKIIKLQHIIVDFVVCRTPCAKVLAIKKEYEGQDLGLVREGGTAEIKEVKPGGLAARYGLPQKAPSMDGSSTCNWFLTEINHRPLNLFFKDNEIHDRLNAVGLDISILVQPIELVKALKKQMKAIRGFKDYTLQ